MTQKLIALDLDGTTLNNESKLSSKTKRVLTSAVQAGHIVSIVTGRPYRLSAEIYDDLHLNTPLINFNGSLGHMPHNQNWDLEYQYTIDRGIAFDLMAHHYEFGINYLAAEGKSLFLAAQDNPIHLGFFPTTLATNQILSQTTLSEDPTSLTIALDRDKQPAVIQYLNDHFGDQVDVAPWGGPDSVLEIGAKGIQKATGVEFIANQYQIDRQNIIAFGDEHNDTAMIDYAGWGVVMQNGTPQLKSIANDITEATNEEDGVANYLTDYLGLAE
ncbi:Cof-type HAD-IIB family hydrolase [Levilactobacillus bambusae]|uniref:HAD family hydrolase n=1 Tax=Levilactobacillus bambusae TaxID=2024736 RepID=A0A2V1N0W2_9LACO|nr:Cof-type HAD-IIB family hydrolase [Levilactobacillus bambusae]PWG00877.1 HAD family hydrolase [Levilactobacillus bambusae]